MIRNEASAFGLAELPEGLLVGPVEHVHVLEHVVEIASLNLDVDLDQVDRVIAPVLSPLPAGKVSVDLGVCLFITL